MKHDEWLKSALQLKLRLIGHLVSEIKQKTQEIYDLLDILATEDPNLVVHDKFGLFERQLHIVDIEAMNLIKKNSEFYHFCSPKKFDDE